MKNQQIQPLLSLEKQKPNQSTKQQVSQLSEIKTQKQCLQRITEILQGSTCIKNNEGFLMCSSQNCKQKDGILCGIKKCECKMLHKKCYKIQVQDLILSISEKIQQKKEILENIQTIFDSIIDQLSQIRDKTISSLRTLFSQPQKNILSVFSSHINLKQASGHDFYEIFQKYKISKEDEDNPSNKQKNKIKNQLSKFQENVNKLIKNLQKNCVKYIPVIKSKEANPQKMLFLQSIDSKIIRTNQELQTLQSFFDTKPISIKLLFRASEHSFNADKFYENCVNIENTLLLVKTKEDKIIGGFTPVAWKTYSGDTQQEDESGKTFIFSVTHKDKLQIVDKYKAISYRPSYKGPRFGVFSNSDLAIVNQSDKSNCYVFSKMNFNNQLYGKLSKHQAYKRFTGSNNQYFHTEQWQLFGLEFI